MSKTILEVKNLSKYFLSKNGVTRAVDDISFSVDKGEIVGLIGQSGSGKTTTGNAIMRILKEVNGIITLNDKVVSGKISKKTKKNFNKKVQMIFQNPHTALNEKRNIYSTLAEPLKVNKIINEETSEFLKNWKANVKNFRYSFMLEYYGRELEFKKERLNEKEKVLNKVKKLIGEADSPQELIVSSYSELKDFESFVNLNLSSQLEKMIKIYIDGNNSILNNKIDKNEKAFLDAKKEFYYAKNIKKNRNKIKNLLKKHLNDRKKDIKDQFNDSHRLLKSLTGDRIKRIKFYKELAAIAKTNDENIKLKYEVNKAKNEYLAVKEIAKHKLITNFKIMSNYDEVIFDEQNPIDKVKEIISNLKLETKAAVDKINLNYEENIKNVKKELAKFDKDLFHKIEYSGSNINEAFKKMKSFQKLASQKFADSKKTYSNYFENAKVAPKNKIEEIKKNINSIELREKEKKLNVLEKELLNAIKLKLKLFMGKDKNAENSKLSKVKKEYKAIYSIYKMELNKLGIYKIERKLLLKSIIRAKTLLGMNLMSSFSLYRYFVIKNLLLKRRIFRILSEVGLKAEHAYRYPHEFSGGQLQRIVIARALIINPKLIIADEPIASLDVSIQAQIINILTRLAKKRNIAMIFIAHDISVIKYIADRMLIMHLGKIVEKGKTLEIFKSPKHPYTKSLFSAVPKLSNANKPFKSVETNNNYILEYKNEKPKMVKITKNHYLYANETQLKRWK